MAQLPVLSLAPGVQLSIRSDGGTVVTTTCNVTNMLSLQAFDHLWSIVAPVWVKKMITCIYLNEQTHYTVMRAGNSTLLIHTLN